MFGPGIFVTGTNTSLIPAVGDLLFGYEVKNFPQNLALGDEISTKVFNVEYIYNILGNNLFRAAPANPANKRATYREVQLDTFNNGLVVNQSNVNASEGMNVSNNVSGATGFSFFAVGGVPVPGNDPVFIASSANGATFRMGQNTWDDGGTAKRNWTASTGSSTTNYQTTALGNGDVNSNFFGATTDFTTTKLYASNFGATGFTYRSQATGGTGYIGTTYSFKLGDSITAGLPTFYFQAVYVYKKVLSDIEISDLNTYINNIFLPSI